MRPGIFVSRTREKLGRTCDQIGRTLEPCSCNPIPSEMQASELSADKTWVVLVLFSPDDMASQFSKKNFKF